MAEGLDWQAAYARLEGVRRGLEAGVGSSPEEVRRILGERAAALARPEGEQAAPAEALDLVAFHLAGERYGLEAARVLEVVPWRGLTPVPGLPPVHLGVVNNRGRILPVLDLRRLLGLAGHDLSEAGKVIAVEGAGMAFGLYADGVIGVLRVDARALAPPPASLPRAELGLLRGITEDLVTVLDAEALARDPRIVVNEEAA